MRDDQKRNAKPRESKADRHETQKQPRRDAENHRETQKKPLAEVALTFLGHNIQKNGSNLNFTTEGQGQYKLTQ